MTTYSQLITTTDTNNNIGASAITFAGQVTGANNVAIGNGAAVGVTTTASGVFLGASANVGTDGLTNVSAIGANATVGANNSVVLGKDCNVGISMNSPTYGLHLGTPANGVTWYKPQIYVASSSAVTTPTANDGVFSVDASAPKFTSTAAYTGTILTTSTAKSGSATLAGTTGVTVPTTAVTTSSIVMVTRNVGAAGAPAIADTGSLTVGSIVNNTSFKVYSTTAGDVANFSWMIINQ